MIDLYGCGSPNVLKVLLMLEETGLSYRLHRVDVHSGEQFAPSFLALNPNAKVPVIVDRDVEGGPFTVFESGAILAYLAEKTGRFMGRTLRERSECLQWTMFQVANIGPMFGQALHFQFIAPAGNEYARRRYLSEVRRVYDVAEARLSCSAWLGGSDYTIADIAAWPWLGKYCRYPGIALPLDAHPHLCRWISAVEARPAYARIHETFKALFKATLDAQREASPDELDRFFGRGRYSRATDLPAAMTAESSSDGPVPRPSNGNTAE